MSNKIKILERIIFWLVFACLMFTILFSIYMAITLPPYSVDPYEGKSKADYILAAVMSISAILVLFAPSILEKKLKIKIPSLMTIFFILFLFASAYLGELRNYYYKLPFWDNLLHFFSSMMMGALSFSIINGFNQYRITKLSPLYVAIFSFCFAMTIGALWEIIEFIMDGIAGLNSQKYATESGTLLVGREALEDTMFDILINTAGAIVMSTIGYISLKHKKSLITKLLAIKKPAKQKYIYNFKVESIEIKQFIIKNIKLKINKNLKINKIYSINKQNSQSLKNKDNNYPKDVTTR